MANQLSILHHAGAIGSAPTGAATATTHKRGYQACIPCRKRKVRCDLGPVDDPHDPPCVRCRRESKECFFSATRRKRRIDGDDEEHGDEDSEVAAHLARRKSARIQGSPQEGSLPPQSPLDPYGQAQNAPYPRSQQYVQSPHGSHMDASQDQEVTNEAAAALFQSPINTPGDALHLLLKASNQSEEFESQEVSSPGTVGGRTDQRHSGAGGNHPLPTTTAFGKTQQTGQDGNATNLDPAITGIGQGSPTPSQEALSIWSRLKFVRAGWFTAREAIAYIDYFYKYLAPLTPIITPDLRDLEANPRLLSEEPVMTVTLLTIASRYVRLTGPGSQTRSLMISERLWQYLQNMMTRMFWGQEQFGGGFCRAGARRSPSQTPDKGRLRTYGTVESLLLLSDFHPRSMHFPPNDDDEDILAPDEEGLRGLSSAESECVPPGNEYSLATWSEPAVRSDRMSWSLIGFAHALAHELGIFGTYADGIVSVDGQVKRRGVPYSQHNRADRIERLLYIYMTQACGRFGFPSMYPDYITQVNLANMSDGFTSVDCMLLESQSPEDMVQNLWVEVASINKACNDKLFPSKDVTARFIRTGEYINLLKELLPTLHLWRDRLDRSKVAKYPKILLSIEVNYFRLYMNGLALQAVIEQWTTKVGGNDHSTSPQSSDSSLSSSFSNIYNQNESYIQEVIDSSRIILKHVVYDLLPHDYLKHAPVRAYFRIVSAAMFLLKTFALGARRIEVETSLLLMDQTINALRTSVVDDVHLCLRIADLLEGLTSKIRRKFIPFTPQSAISPRLSSNNRLAYSDIKQQISSPSQPQINRHGIRYVRQQPQGAPGTHPSREASGASYLGAADSNITIMPPPRGVYNNTAVAMNTINNQYISSSNQPYEIPQTPHHQESYPLSSNPNPDSTYVFPSAEDWLTLDLQPLLDNSNNGGLTNGNGGGGGGGTDDNGSGNGSNNSGSGSWWLGNAFGPETQNNLEVLGKLVNEGGSWPAVGGDGMGF